VKLLLDENLSRRLVTRLAESFPGSTHVTAVGLDQATDRAIWEYARSNDFVIVSKDSDFNDLAFMHGPPPKAIWVRVGNASTSAIEALLDVAVDTVSAFAASDQDAVLVLTPRRDPSDKNAR
jgi:predicted nuclease of predicted toxin-antitoxin system